MARSPRRRHRFLVEGFQAQFVLTQIVWVAGAFLLLIGVVIGPLVYQLLSAGSSVPLEVADRLLFFHSSLWPFLLGLFSLLLFVFLVMSHRIAGPLHRFRQVFKAVGEGRLDTAVRLRQRDYLKREAEALDAMVVALRERVSRAQRDARALRQRIDTLVDRPPLNVRADLQSLAHDAAAVCASLDTFVVDRPAVAPAHATSAVTRPDTVRSSSGFSLIELMIAMGIVVTLAALAAPAYTNALESARVARAIGDIHAIGEEIMIAFVRLGCFPDNLTAIGRDGLKDPWGQPYRYGVVPTRGTSAQADPQPSFDARLARVRRASPAHDGCDGPAPVLSDAVRGVAARADRDVAAPMVWLAAAQGRGGGGRSGGGGSGGGSDAGSPGDGGTGGSTDGGSSSGGGTSSGGGGTSGGGGGSHSGCGACTGSCLSMGEVRKDGRLVPLNSDFDLYSSGRNGRSVGPLTSSLSQDDVVRASNGAFINLARKY